MDLARERLTEPAGNHRKRLLALAWLEVVCTSCLDLLAFICEHSHGAPS